MKHQKTISLLSLLVILCLNACDNREDAWKAKDIFSTFTLKKANNKTLYHNTDQSAYLDTIKVGFESKYIFQLERNNECTFELGFNKAIETFSLDKTTSTLTYKGLVAGSSTVYFKIIDPWNQEKTVPFNIISKSNLLPVATATISHKAVINGYLITIDASKSYDKDAAIGGKVISYKFEIVNQQLKTMSESVYADILTNTGTYSIYVTVMDNDNEWSIPTGYQYTIN